MIHERYLEFDQYLSVSSLFEAFFMIQDQLFL